MIANRKFGIGVLLAAILLMSIISTCIPPAAAAIDGNIIEKNYVSMEDAKVQAKSALIEYLAIGAPGPESINWTDAIINPAPIMIYDINGKKLFYHFTIEKNNTSVGAIKIAASKVLGNPIRTIEFYSSEWDLKNAAENAKKEIEKNHKYVNLTSSKLVCYSYPKIGIMLNAEDPESKEHNVTIISLSGSYSIANRTDQFNSFDENNNIWSYYAIIPKQEVEERVAVWNENYKYAKETKAIDHNELTVNSRIPGIQLTLPNFNHFKQKNETCCAAATGQMIADYYDVYHTQDYIAERMGIDSISGASTYRQLRYYYKHGSGLGKSGSEEDTSPTWIEAKNEIYSNRPFADAMGSGFTGHMRACAGYCQGLDGNYYLYIYDPWDQNLGDDYPGGIYWENFDSVTHSSYIYVRD